jgi:histidine triad (HIT) family protein
VPGSDPCVFCAIVRGEKESDRVLEDRHCIAFLDHRPLFPGHALLVPRPHHETLAALPPALVEPLFQAAQVLSRAVEEAMDAEGSFVAMNNTVSQSVPHLHVHVVPRRRKDGLRGFFWPRQAYASVEARRDVQARLRDAVQRLQANPNEKGGQP